MSAVRQKIFVSVYACEPHLGSEIGVGWHWVVEMSKYFDLWVLTRASNRDSIEAYLKANPQKNIPTFIYYDLPQKLRFWKKGLRGVHTYYHLWQWLSNPIVKKTMVENNIKIFHHLTYGNALWPVSKYGRKQFFVWGPVGGLETIPAEFTACYSLKSRLLESIRRFVVITTLVNMGFKMRCRAAQLILCKTKSTYERIPCKYRDKAIICTDVAVEKEVKAKTKSSNIENRSGVNYIAVGRFDSWRGFDILIDAFAIASRQCKNIRLEIVGWGTDRARLESLIRKNGVESMVTICGRVSQDEYLQKMADCDVVVNPALKEGAVTVAFDSLAFGKPLICIDTGGYTRYFNNNHAIVIPRTSRHEVVERMADAITVMSDPLVRCEKAAILPQVAAEYDWHSKGVFAAEEILRRYNIISVKDVSRVDS